MGVGRGPGEAQLGGVDAPVPTVTFPTAFLHEVPAPSVWQGH